jgi:Transmembrane protein 43
LALGYQLLEFAHREISMPVPEDIGSDVFTETTHVGFGQKLIGSVVGALFGVLLLAASSIGLFWNEGRAVTTARSLSEGAQEVVSVAADRVAPENEGRLVHVTGPLTTTAPLADPEFGVTVQAAVLARQVEMYQWKEEQRTETSKNFGGSEERTTVYTYVGTWSSHRIDSSRFKQSGKSNPQMRYQSVTIAAKDATLGGFRPSEGVLRRLAAKESLPVDTALEGRIRERGNKTQIVDGVIYLGADPANPAIGDLRISYHVARPTTATIVGRQSGWDFATFQTKAGDALLFAKSGAVTAADIFAQAQEENRMLTWILRAVGIVVMLIGFALLCSPLIALGDIIPIVGSILGAGAVFVAIFLTALLAPLVIASAWLWYRPLIALGVMGVGVGIAILTRLLTGRRKFPAAQPQAASAVST